MSLILYDGPNFSGRSDALRKFAWSEASSPQDGQYLSASINSNLSGLARTIEGEQHLHGFALRRRRSSDNTVFERLIGHLPVGQNLASLSGGETVRLLLACTIALRPRRLAIDDLLEQIDQKFRSEVLQGIIAPLARDIDIHVSDNNPGELSQLADGRIEFKRSAQSPDLNSQLPALAQRIGTKAVSAPSLELRDLSFRYSRTAKNVLSRTNYKFEPGVPYLLKAPNGAGKSTLAKLLVGVLKPVDGTLVTNGESFSSHRSDTNLFFYAFQNPLDQIFGGSASGYLAMIARVAARRATKMSGKLGFEPHDALDGFGLSVFSKTEPFDLPFVAAKRLCHAAAILSRSPWLFFDEPALGSDQQGRDGLAAVFKALCAAGLGVIIVTHGQEFDGLPGRVTVTIRDGQIVEGE